MGGFFKEARFAFNAIRNLASRLSVAPPYRPSPWDSVPRRHYYVDRYQVQHFKPRGPRRWLQNPRNVFLVVLVGSGVVITVYFGNLETIPYTKRSTSCCSLGIWRGGWGRRSSPRLRIPSKGRSCPRFIRQH
ncbi:hypothetical protein MLD38_029104 [Melastoma candidum]|uniref:Uncharacterized protein n=1 Tax=Melastoma candidum TaxID=119954 RepID=A0ACB9N5E5_9MYRT|nr:hypothetical protein MLD38_029104 [Melastoma candidum]